MARAFSQASGAGDGESGKICRAGARAAVLGCRPPTLKPLNSHAFLYAAGLARGLQAGHCARDRRGPAVSSTASNVSATPAVASSPWPQTAAASQDNAQDHGGGPFAALLDAAAAAPDTTNTAAATGRPAHVHGGAPINSRRNSPPAATVARPAQPRARRRARRRLPARRKTRMPTATPVASFKRSGRSKPGPERDANQAGTAAPTDIAVPARHSTFLPGQPRPPSPTQRPMPPTPDATTKTAPDNQDDSGSETDAAAVVAAAAAANVQAQPVAAAVITNTIINTPPAATAAAAPNMAIGSSAAASATSALPIVDAKTAASSQNAGDPLATSDASNASVALTPIAHRWRRIRCRLRTPRLQPRGKTPKRLPRQETPRPSSRRKTPRSPYRRKPPRSPRRRKPPSRARQASKHRNGNAPIANVDNADAGSPADATDGQA